MSLLIWKGPTNALAFAPTSPTLTYGDRVKAVDVYRGQQALCAASMLARGTFGTGFRTGYVVNQCTCTNERGSIGTLTIEWEAGGASAIQPLPVGDYILAPQEIYPKIERNTYFDGILPQIVRAAYCCLYQATNFDGSMINNDYVINTAAGLKVVTPATATAPAVYSTPTTDQATQISLANNLLLKLMRGEETFYIAGWRYTYWYYSYTIPTLSIGARIATPGGPLAGNLPSNTVWLRLADNCEPAGVNGSMYKVTSTFLGGPIYGGIGYWDPNLYPAF
jgi:hypothetical protein